MRLASVPVIVTALLNLIGVGALTRPLPANAFTPAEAKAPMSITLVRSDAADCGTNCPQWLALSGRIVPETPALLRASLGRLGGRRIPVLIDSPGGAVEAAMTMGRMIRERHLDVAVAGTGFSECAKKDGACLSRRRAGERTGFVAGGVAACASACVLVLAGGTDRSVAENSYVGVHQMITRKTLNRVMNTFRVVRRRVGGRVIEVSRTLVASRTVSSRTVQEGASDQKYSEVERYLLGMGIGESIMPLMRTTPPSGIHWMPPIELATTRISTDTTDARTLVARSILPRDATTAKPPVPAPAALTLGARPRQEGTATWRLDRNPASTPEAPKLASEIDIPGRHLHGSLSIARNTDPAKAASFVLRMRLSSPPEANAEAATSIGAPKICDAETCSTAILLGSFGQWSASDYVYWFSPRNGDLLLSALRDRKWLTLPVEFADGSGELGLSLAAAARATILDWQQLCCGLAPPLAVHAATEGPPSPIPPGSLAVHRTPERVGLRN